MKDAWDHDSEDDPKDGLKAAFLRYLDDDRFSFTDMTWIEGQGNGFYDDYEEYDRDLRAAIAKIFDYSVFLWHPDDFGKEAPSDVYERFVLLDAARPDLYRVIDELAGRYPDERNFLYFMRGVIESGFHEYEKMCRLCRKLAKLDTAV